MFITVEGIEGSGKTSQIQNIMRLIQAWGYPCIATREPGGTPIGAQIRAILLNPANTALDPVAELMLYIADRVQHLRTVIMPQLSAGAVVLCDRFFDATLVYQGYARGLDVAHIRALHRLVCDDIEPDLTLLLDVDPVQGLKRAWDRIRRNGGPELDSRFEQEKLEFHHRVRDGYLTLARQAPHRFRIIDAGQNEDRVAQDIEVVLTALFPGAEKKTN